MRRILIAAILAFAATPTLAAEEDIVLRGMGSFHVGGRIAEVSGKPVRMIVRQPGGPLTKLDPNGQYMVEQMYVQHFLPRSRKGKLPLLMWHGGGLTGVTYESTPDGREGWLNLFVRKATSPMRWSAVAPVLRLPISGRRSRPSSPMPIRSNAFASATARARGAPIRPSAACCWEASFRSRPMTIT